MCIRDSIPTDRPVVILPGGLIDRLDEPTLHAQPVPRLGEQVADRVLFPEARRNRDRCGLPGDRLGAVLTKFQRLAVVRIRPGTTHAVLSLIHISEPTRPY